VARIAWVFRLNESDTSRIPKRQFAIDSEAKIVLTYNLDEAVEGADDALPARLSRRRDDRNIGGSAFASNCAHTLDRCSSRVV
jgi:hypothetical protein